MATTTTTKPIELEITSDTVCPFCYVGYRRIRQAIREVESDPSLSPPPHFTLRFAPFQLDPTLPLSPGENKLERYERRFGGKEKVDAMVKAMYERGLDLQPPVKFSYGGNVSNTKDSHRLIEKAWNLGGQEAQLKIVEALFALYFEHEGDIGSHEALADVADKSGIKGLSKAETLEFLKGDELKDEMEKGFAKAQMRGISGVPFTIINQQFGVSGAQETETFKEVFRKLAKGELQA
ncbi:hypothetical protein JCM11251_000530 [Rhodosporidiobolus azoricus]